MSKSSNPIIPKHKLVSKKIGLFIIGGIAAFFVISSIIGQIRLPGTKVDDWQYQASQTKTFSSVIRNLDLTSAETWRVIFRSSAEYIQSLSSVEVLTLFGVFGLSLAGSIGWWFLNYSLIRFILIRVFKLNLDKDKKIINLVAGLGLFLGLGNISLLIWLMAEQSSLILPALVGFILALGINLFGLLVAAIDLLVLGTIAGLKKSGLNIKIKIKDRLVKIAGLLNPVYIFGLVAPIFIAISLNLFGSLPSPRISLFRSSAPAGGIGGGSLGAVNAPVGYSAKSLSMAESMPTTGGGGDTVGLSTGGAKDINNFRRNIENDYLPIVSDLTPEGLFYDYYFETGPGQKCEEGTIFCPSYNYAVSQDPISGQEEKYLSVGLDSNIKKSDFERKKLNLVIVLDISGSMGSAFNRYYYDQPQNPNPKKTKNKIEVANQSVAALLDHLNPDDRFGMVLFNNSAYTAKPLRKIETTDMKSIENHILEIQANGGTNMAAGYEQAAKMLTQYTQSDKSEYENRIIFLTDAQPNQGALSEDGLVGLSKKQAEKEIFTTFIGVGVDFNSKLIEAMTKIEGANYYAVHSNEEFKQRMDDGFEHMVTPLVFDLKMEFESSDYDIEAVYGSPEADKATGEIMYVNTLFPSDKQQGKVKGGIILLKLKALHDGEYRINDTVLQVSYRDRQGQEHTQEQSLNLGGIAAPYYDHNGIRKAIALTRYTNLLRHWIDDERTYLHKYPKGIADKPFEASIDEENGIIIYPDQKLSPWERRSQPLNVSEEYQALFSQFESYLKQEKKALGDKTLEQEEEILEKLTNR